MSRTLLQFAGANDDGQRPTHINLSADACWHAGLRVAWVRWVTYHFDGTDAEYGRWEPVVPGKPFIDPRPGKLG